uniref:APOPT family protein Y39B6A.34, mitochondrial-like n=1 Tax=Dermatophagoides pteronyssinus TaxID=6956 RepID=A0A6P6XQ61_DERPT|nr:APOPT family protein Y39B6A.34, mitochondrial-like [Dermatophagoides pteronyssinus]
MIQTFWIINNRQWRNYDNIIVKIIRPITNRNDRLIQTSSSSSSHKSKQKDKVSAIPHPTSKLRLFNYAVQENETDYEKRLRLRRIQIQNLNHEYWSKINTEFNQKKKNYVENELKNRQSEMNFDSTQTHEELAQFYKKFLDDNHQRYISYNSQWYRNNLNLLWHSLIVSFIRLGRRFHRK